MTHTPYLLPTAIAALFLLERRFPLCRAKSPLGGRLLVNAVISALALALVSSRLRVIRSRVVPGNACTRKVYRAPR